MDPLSVSASIIAVLGATEEIIKYLQDVKHGGEQRQKLLDEVTSLWAVLRHLNDTLPKSSATKQQLHDLLLSDQSGGVLEQCKELIQELRSRLQPKIGSGKLLQNLRWSFAKEEIQQKVGQLHRFQNIINGALAQISLSVSDKIASDTQASLSILEEQELAKIRKWLSPTNFSAQHAAISENHCPGTGTTFLESYPFKQWLLTPNHILWCSGDPGAGKTHLASMTVNYLRGKFVTNDTFVLVAYCQYDDQPCQKLENIIGDLIRQTIIDRRIPEALGSLYRNSVSMDIGPPLSDLLSILTEQLKGCQSAYIILDAVDEIADHEDRAKLLALLRPSLFPASIMVTSRPLDDINRCLEPCSNICDGCFPKTGKYKSAIIPHEPILYRCFGGCDIDFCPSCYKMGNTCKTGDHAGKTKRVEHGFRYIVFATPADLRQYIEWKTSSDVVIRSLVSSRADLKDELVETTLRRSDSMFLLAKLLMDAVASCLSVKQLRRALQDTPVSLNAAYDATIRRIDSQGPQAARIAYDVLTWVAFAKRRLTSEELEHAIAIEIGLHEFDKDGIIPAQKLVDLCSGLVMINRAGQLHFIHPTVREYMITHTTVVGLYPDFYITNKCLTYLLYEEFGLMPCQTLREIEQRVIKYPFLRYCVWGWGKHLGNNFENSECFQRVQDLFRSENHWQSAVHSWCYIDDPYFDFWGDQRATSIHYAAGLGIIVAVDDILAADASQINATDYNGYTPIMIAVSNKHFSLVSKLLEYKADVNILGDHGTALHLAAQTGDLDILEALLATPGIDLDRLDKTGVSALTFAIIDNHVEAALRLVRCGADVGATGGHNYTALGEAITGSLSVLVDTLLASGKPCINLFSAGCSPLMIAAMSCQIETVRKLLKFPDIDLNAQSIDENLPNSTRTSDGETALMLAIVRRDVDITNLLLEQDGLQVDIVSRSFSYNNTRRKTDTGAGWTALFYAIDVGDLKVVRTLLSKGASRDIMTELSVTPLIQAASLNNTEVVSCLLTWPGNHTPDSTADESTKLPVTMAPRTFAEKPKDEDAHYINMRSGPGLRTALHWAIFHHNIEMAKTLIAYGADIHMRDKSGLNPMDYYALSSEVQEIQELSLFDQPEAQLCLPMRLRDSE